jgi:DUF1009 family protein
VLSQSSHSPNPSSPRKIGLVAGWGDYPLVVARALREQGHQVISLGIKDHVDSSLESLSDAYRTLGLGRMGTALRFFRRHGVTQATMAGKVHKVLIFRKFHVLKHFPDWRCLRTFYPHWITRTQDRKDDTLLGAVVDAFAKEGIQFLPATDFMPELLVKYGRLAGRALSRGQWKDVQFGWKLAKEMGRLDVGQTVAVKGQAVLAVEAVEGTDECIRRAGQLADQSGFTVVKVAKPRQDMRFDVPTIGRGTLETLVASGGRVLAVESGKTIIIDQAEVVQFATRHGVSLVAVNEQELEQYRDAA